MGQESSLMWRRTTETTHNSQLRVVHPPFGAHPLKRSEVVDILKAPSLLSLSRSLIIVPASRDPLLGSLPLFHPRQKVISPARPFA